MHNLSLDGYQTVQALKSADNETLTGSGVDMLGYESVMFLVGALHGEELTFTIKVQQDSDSEFGTAADLEGTSDTFTTDVYTDGLCSSDIHQPQERYVRPVITVPDAVSAKSVFCVAIQYNAKYKPISNTNNEIHVSPDEGTA